MKPKYINVERLLYAIRALPDTPNGYSDTYDKATIIAMVEDFVDTEIPPDCRENCDELNRALSALQLSMQDTQLAVKERAMFARSTQYYKRLYWHAYHHPFRFFFTALFHKKWKVGGAE